MRLTFRVHYHTTFGQSLLLTGDHPLFGKGDIAKAIPLQYLDEQFWQTTITIPNAAVPDVRITYNYVLGNPDGSLVYDWGKDKTINPASFEKEELLVIDSWSHTGAVENAFYTVPFKKVLLKRDNDVTPAFLSPPKRPSSCTHIFRVKSPLLAPNQTLCILGSGSVLQNWNTTRPAQLCRHADDNYSTVQLNLSNEKFPVEYKYGVYDLKSDRFIRFEDGPNRVLCDNVAAQKVTIVNDGFASLFSTTWKGAGVAIPVFSLRSENSFGVGEFADLKLLADWCKRAGVKLIQVLPINDTITTHTWSDSYPYAAISAFALHPLYLNLAQIASPKNKPLLEKLAVEKQRLNSLEAVDYEAVLNTKLRFLNQIYPSQKAATFESSDYQEFFEQNKQWLAPYAAFSCLRDKYGTADFTRWPNHQRYDADAITKEFDHQNAESILAPAERGDDASKFQEASDPSSSAIIETPIPHPSFYYFLQYHLHRQLKEATEHIHSRGIILKGDIAIGVSRFGADAWQSPDLFHMEFQAGAPPDAFGVKGQNWGFPTYDWPRMKETGFAWWKQRFEQMGRYFDAFRIDHILGFFRIWSVPLHAIEGILGYFVPAIPVHVGEFHNRSIPFEWKRYVEPFITDPILKTFFGESSEFIKGHFLQPDDHNRYRFKPQFSNQRQIEAQFESWVRSEHNEKLKLGLFDLISNVLLFEVQRSNGQQFHFRFGIESSSSFKNLPYDVQARLKDLYIDYFFRRQDDFWMKEAMEKLPALKRVTNMLVCGEDLGLVPACVPQVMKDLGLLSLEIQRMPKQLGREFFHPKDAPYLSVVTPSTHDMSTIRGWWEEDRGATQRFYNRELGRSGAAPDKCEPSLVEAIISQHLNSPAMWSIFQIQDLLGIDHQLRHSDPAAERINVPANPKNYWRYRMHVTLETLLSSIDFTNRIGRLVQQSGR
jgi:4-alpha-glucanotransferase